MQISGKVAERFKRSKMLKIGWLLRNRPFSRAVNLMKVRKDAVRQEPTPDFLPTFAHIEPTNRCNLKCETCILGTDLAYVGYKMKDMTLEEFKTILDSMPSLMRIFIQGTGEPLLNKELFDMVEYASSRGVRCGTVTNGLILGEQNCRKVLDSSLEVLEISLNSPDAAVFAATRSGARVEKVLANVERLVRMRAETKGSRLTLAFRAILMQSTKADATALIDTAVRLGVDKVCYQGCEDIVGTGVGHERIPKLEYEDRSAQLIAYGRARGVIVEIESYGDGTGSCRAPWESTNVTVEGFVTPCCVVGTPTEGNFGNVFDAGFEAVWKNQSATEFRENFRKARPDACRGCSKY